MKKILASIITISIMASCHKEEKSLDPVANALTSLQGKYLVCDSVKTTVNGQTTTQVLGKGKGWDRSFGLYGNLDIFSNPPAYKNYAYASPDKIYYWNANTTYQPDIFYTIVSATSNRLVIIEKEQGTGKIFTAYFTADN